MTKKQISQIQDGGRPLFWKMILSLYLSRRSSDFDEICCADACFDSENGHLTKNENFA